jgi:transposase
VIRSLGSGGREVSTKPVMGTTATERRHKRWPEALKREIVAASLAPGASVSIVARQYDVNANQVFSWRKRYREDACAPPNSTVPQLVPVVITAEQDAVAAQPPVVTEKIEIDVSGKYRIRVACGFDGQALRRVPEVT